MLSRLYHVANIIIQVGPSGDRLPGWPSITLYGSSQVPTKFWVLGDGNLAFSDPFLVLENRAKVTNTMHPVSRGERRKVGCALGVANASIQIMAVVGAQLLQNASLETASFFLIDRQRYNPE